MPVSRRSKEGIASFMERPDAVPADDAKASADTDEGLPSSEEENVDHAQSAPADDEPAEGGPSVGSAFRSGS